MTDDRKKDMRSDLNGVAMRALRSAENRRQLTRMPLFRVDFGATKQMSDLLNSLDAAENRQKRS